MEVMTMELSAGKKIGESRLGVHWPTSGHDVVAAGFGPTFTPTMSTWSPTVPINLSFPLFVRSATAIVCMGT